MEAECVGRPMDGCPGRMQPACRRATHDRRPRDSSGNTLNSKAETRSDRWRPCRFGRSWKTPDRRDTVSNMKTTIDVADALLREAREVATRDHTTLKDLVQEGLRRVLDERRPRRQAFRLRLVEPGSGGFQPEFADGDWQRMRDEIYRGRGT